MSVVMGELVAGRFRLQSELGKGGMGTVYRASQEALRRPVALKLLLPHLAEDELSRARFEREARVASQLRHPNAVEVYDFGTDGGMLYLAMELLEGQPLRDRLDASFGRLEVGHALEVARQISEALIAAHRLSLVHRDIKPENIFLEPEPNGGERAVVVDFGLAFIADHDELGRVTRQGTLFGSPAYMSPEQARDPKVEAPSDIYALGCVLHEMVTGAVPFAGGGLKVLSLHCFAMPESPKQRFPELNIPSALDALILRMLRKRPADRPTAEDVRRALVELRDGARVTGERVAARVLGRQARMVSKAPTELVASLPAPPEPLGESVRLVGELPERTLQTLRANGFVVGPEEVGSLVLALEQPPEALATLAAENTVVADAEPGDLDRISALLRAGVAEVLPRPVGVEALVRQLKRALRRSKRRG